MADDGDRVHVDVMTLARTCDEFRRVVSTGQFLQVVVMTIQPGDDIGAETHEDHDQVIVLVEGSGTAVLDGTTMAIGAGDLVFVHAGVHHNVVNDGAVPMRIVTAYGPPEHPAGTVHATKDDADH